MGKVSVEQRLQAVQRYLNGYETMIEIAKDTGVTVQVVSEWVRRYQKNGVETFLRSYTKYSADYKMNVLNYMNETGTSSKRKMLASLSSDSNDIYSSFVQLTHSVS